MLISPTKELNYHNLFIRNSFLFISTVGIFMFFSCQEKKSYTLFELIPSSKTKIRFSNNLKPTFDHNILDYNYFYNGGGVAAADFNNDGLTDLYFTGNQVSSKLYLNKGNFLFEDITDQANVSTKNWATGVSVADINNDGLQDMFVSYAGYKDPLRRTHQFFINKGIGANGIPMFKDEAALMGLADTSYTSQSAFLDYDRDGDLDLFLVNHFQDLTNPNYPKKKRTDGASSSANILYRNDNGSFSNVSKQTGILEDGYSLSVALSDINQDGWIDIYVTNDFVFDDVLYLNNRNGTFTERIKEYIKHTSRFSMGCDIADFNNDSYPDIISADMLPDDNSRQKLMNIAMSNDRFNLTLDLGYMPQYSRNMLQVNNGPDANGHYSFSEIGQLAGVSRTDWSWSTLFADFDNDGWKDLFISNGIPQDITNNDFITYRDQQILTDKRDFKKMKTLMLEQIDKLKPVDKSDFIFKNNKDLTFSDKTTEWGLSAKSISTGSVYVDLDNDGDLDLVTNNINEAAFVYENQSQQIYKNNYLRVKLNGSYAIGAKISINCNGRKQFIEHNTSRGFQSTQDPIEHFGLGQDNIVDTLEVVWLDGKKQTLSNVSSNQLIILNYANSKAETEVTSASIPDRKSMLFNKITDQSRIDFVQHQNGFEDFNHEPLLPNRFSKNGPYMATADVDGNGMADFWIGGSAKLPGKLFKQQKNGDFIINDMPDPGYEDMGGVFFDADGDKDMDLYIVSGGNVYNPLTAPYQDRLYLNDGKGNFEMTQEAIPVEYASGSCVAAHDYDRDGDVDLFVGGRVIPTRYPFAPQSFLLKNTGHGYFEDGTQSICPELKKIGMVTSALWTDFDSDGWLDLIVTGEWMPVTFFKNKKGVLKLVEGNKEINKSTGWWQSIAEGDFDNDGDMDYIAGNWGLNNYYNVSEKYPLSVYAKDFDNNGSVEPILSYYLNGKEYSIANRDQITSVMPSFKKKFESYTKFAESDFNEIFSSEDLKGALILRASTLNSVYIENQGADIFAFHSLPIQAQFSPIRAIVVNDFDVDGNLDILMSGNSNSPDFVTGRQDASNGLVLKGNGKGHFTALTESKSGISIHGDARSMLRIKLKNGDAIISAVNEGALQVFQLAR